MKRLAGSRSIGGFYNRRPGRSIIFTAAITPPASRELRLGSLTQALPTFDLNAQTVLLHEYSHHFMYANFTNAFPLWFSEGFAEFNGNARFETNGDVVIGLEPTYRAYGLIYGKIPIARLFEPPKTLYSDNALTDTFYARGWRLTHYLMVEGKRQDQLNKYLVLLNQGKPGLEAARTSFGDLADLDDELDRAAKTPSLSELIVQAHVVPPVTITPLTPGTAAVLPTYLVSARGVDEKTAPAVADTIEAIAAHYPNDARAQTMLAEAEYDADRDGKAEAAADRALLVDPGNVGALLYKGRLATRKLIAKKTEDVAAWKEARSWFVRANHAAPDAAEPLLLYYESYLQAGQAPPDIAYRGLLRARELAPEYDGARMLIAGHMLAAKDVKNARDVLQPVAFDPHSSDPRARKAIDAIDAGDLGAAEQSLRLSDIE